MQTKTKKTKQVFGKYPFREDNYKAAWAEGKGCFPSRDGVVDSPFRKKKEALIDG